MRLRFEKLESRQLMASDWQNAVNPYDVDGSSSVTPFDALMVINDLIENGAHATTSKPANYSGPLFDVSGDGGVTAFDALLVINKLNSIPSIGKLAPAVSLPNQDGELVDISKFIGVSPVVLYFYPKDNTPGCTIEAQDFRDRADEIAALGAKVFGVSLDGVASHQSFSSQLDLNFDILSDEDQKVSTAFGVLSQINNTPIAQRTTFIIGTDGTIKKIFTDVQVSVHGQQVIDSLKSGVS